MAQEEILKILEKKGALFGTEIINVMRGDGGASKEYVRKRLEQLRKFSEVGYIWVGIHGQGNCETVLQNNGLLDIKLNNNKIKVVKASIICQKFPRIKERLELRKIRREVYLYFIDNGDKKLTKEQKKAIWRAYYEANKEKYKEYRQK